MHCCKNVPNLKQGGTTYLFVPPCFSYSSFPDINDSPACACVTAFGKVHRPAPAICLRRKQPGTDRPKVSYTAALLIPENVSDNSYWKGATCGLVGI